MQYWYILYLVLTLKLIVFNLFYVFKQAEESDFLEFLKFV